MKNFKQLLVALSLLTIFTNCGGNKSSVSLTQSDVDSINVTITMLQDSVASTWKVMEEEDDLKLIYIKRLLDEVSYTNIFNKSAYDSLTQKVESLKAMRYNQETMSNSNLINDYDNMTREIINEVIQFAENHPKFEDYPIMKELIDDIIELDHKVIYRRVDYDNIANGYNQYLESNRESIYSSTKNTGKKALFQLTE